MVHSQLLWRIRPLCLRGDKDWLLLFVMYLTKHDSLLKPSNFVFSHTLKWEWNLASSVNLVSLSRDDELGSILCCWHLFCFPGRNVAQLVFNRRATDPSLCYIMYDIFCRKAKFYNHHTKKMEEDVMVPYMDLGLMLYSAVCKAIKSTPYPPL